MRRSRVQRQPGVGFARARVACFASADGPDLDPDPDSLDDRTGEVELSCSTETARSMGAVPTNWVIRVRKTGDSEAGAAWKIDRITFESVYGKPPTPRIW